MEVEKHVESIEEKKERKKKCNIVYPLMEYLSREKSLVDILNQTELKKHLFIYGFSSETKKNEVITFLNKLNLKTPIKCLMRTMNRPTAILSFQNDTCCENSYKIIQESLDKLSKTSDCSAPFWSVARASNFYQKLPKKSKLSQSKIIIRNIPFNLTEDCVFKTFKKCGPITSIKFLTRINDDGHLVRKGCCFVQFCRHGDALRASKFLNETKLYDRSIVVDLAVDKDIYQSNKSTDNALEDGSKDDDIKDDESKDGDSQDGDSQDGDSQDGDSQDGDSQDGDTENQVLAWEISTNANTTKKVDESEKLKRTVFVQNISWITELQAFQKFMEEKFGTVEFCRFVFDKNFNQPKGCGFVRFSTIEEFNNCINAEENILEDIILDGKKLMFLRAMSRDDLNKKQVNEQELKEEKDNRNLKLASLGLTYEREINGKEDEVFKGAFLTDYEKKLRGEELKSKQARLKNTSLFVSPTRLCVRNIPTYVDESVLSRKFQKLGGKTCRLKTVRLARFDLNTNNDQSLKKKGKSKGFAFIEFTKHEFALKALKASANQNSQQIFPKDQKEDIQHSERKSLALMVEFSVENTAAIQQQIKRKQYVKNILQKSKESNFSNYESTTKPQKRKLPLGNEIKKIGKYVKSGNHGNNVKSGNHGNNVKSGNHGNNVKSGNHGNNVKSGNHGNNAKSGNHGNNAKSGNHGNNAKSGSKRKLGKKKFTKNNTTKRFFNTEI